MSFNKLTCLVPVKYVKRDAPYSFYEDFFSIHHKGEYNSKSSNIVWEGLYNNYLVTITQPYHCAEIEEDHIKYELKEGEVNDDSIVIYFSKIEIAKSLNEHIYNTFR